MVSREFRHTCIRKFLSLKMDNQIEIYQGSDGQTQIEVKFRKIQLS